MRPDATLLQTSHGIVESAVVGEGPAFLCLHGAMGGWDQALILGRAIAPPSGSRVVALSRPGYLGTPLGSGRSPEDQADLYAAMLDTLGIAEAVVVAVSGGGRSALQLALRHRDRCRALVLVSTVGEPMTEGLSWSRSLKLWLVQRGWLATSLRRRVERDPASAARRAIRDPETRARTLADPDSGPMLREILLSSVDRIARRLPGTRADIEAGRAPTPPLEDIRVPTLVVHGTEDPVVPLGRHGAILAQRIPGAELFAVDGGEHFVILSHRSAIRARVATFLEEHGA